MEERPAGVVNGGGVSGAHVKGEDFLVENLLPGNYIVTTQGFPSSYVSSITAGGVDLNSHPYMLSLKLGPSCPFPWCFVRMALKG
jgi:hypothetical protein